MDPDFITRGNWSDIGDFLFGLLFVPGLAILFALNMLIAHALIPSLVASGHIPEDFNKARPLFYMVALAALAGIASFLIYIGLNAHGSWGDIYSRWWL